MMNKYYETRKKINNKRKTKKRKTKKRKKSKRGGGYTEIQEFTSNFINQKDGINQDIWKLTPQKPVATPDSGAGIKKLLQSWNNLKISDKKYITENWFPTNSKFKSRLGVFIYPSIADEHVANKIIFYLPTYLDCLANISGNTIDGILNILAVVQTDEENINLINIAFDEQIIPLTPAGEELKQKYKDCCEPPSNMLNCKK